MTRTSIFAPLMATWMRVLFIGVAADWSVVDHVLIWEIVISRFWPVVLPALVAGVIFVRQRNGRDRRVLPSAA